MHGNNDSFNARSFCLIVVKIIIGLNCTSYLIWESFICFIQIILIGKLSCLVRLGIYTYKIFFNKFYITNIIKLLIYYIE